MQLWLRILNRGSSLQAGRCDTKILLTFDYISFKVRVDIDGSGAGNDRSFESENCAGETQKGLHLCGLWPTVWVPVTAASAA